MGISAAGLAGALRGAVPRPAPKGEISAPVLGVARAPRVPQPRARRPDLPASSPGRATALALQVRLCDCDAEHEKL